MTRKSRKNVAVCSSSFSKNKYLQNLIKSKFTNVKFNLSGKRLTDEKLVTFLKNAEIAIVALEKIDDKLVKKLPKLKLISKFGIGNDNIDLNILKKNNIKIVTQQGTNSQSVAELVICFSIMYFRDLYYQINNNKNNIWKNTVGVNLSEKRFGIIGCGNVGKKIVNILKPFNCKIFVYDKINYKNFNKQHKIYKVSLKKLITNSDIISINLPMDKTTINFINSTNLKYFKSDSCLINTSRGGIVNEIDLYSHMKKNKNFNAFFDVMKKEPNINSKLTKLNNFYLSSHIGGSTTESIKRMGLAAIEGILKND